MNRIAAFGIIASLSLTAGAAQNDLLVSFSTKGTDTYADSSEVLDGECYALVWDDASAPFAVAADGTTTGGEIVLVAPLARKGRCPKVMFEVDADLAAERYSEGGDWKVYLLDTRIFGAGGVTLAPFKDGRPTVVNAAGVVGDASVTLSAGSPVSCAVDAATSAATASAVPAAFGDVKPRISGIDVRDGMVYVTVEDTLSCLAYDLSTGATPDAVSERVNDPRTGGDDGKVILVSPAKEGGAFFRVNRN